MTITDMRIYLEYDDPQTARDMALTHWGVSTWLKARLKSIKAELRGAEVKGVNIVNIMLRENTAGLAYAEQWRRYMNSFEFNHAYDLQALRSKPSVENIRNLIPLISKLAAEAPWPQVRAIGRLLSTPLNQGDLAEITEHLERWAAHARELKDLLPRMEATQAADPNMPVEESRTLLKKMRALVNK